MKIDCDTDIMGILEKQKIGIVYENSDAVDHVLSASNIVYGGSKMGIANVFLYGYLQGKRAERARRKGRA